jgi:hypothetical protein
MPSNTFTACQCFGWMSQHVGSIHTLGKATATEFTIKINNTGGYRWWFGILWSTSKDGFQHPRVDETNDSFNDLEGLDSVILSYQGCIQRFGKKGYYGEKVTPWGIFPESPSITIRIINADDAHPNSKTSCETSGETSGGESFVEFDITAGFRPVRIKVNHCDQGRPFIQFDRQNSLLPSPSSDLSCPPITCTIQTPLFSSR